MLKKIKSNLLKCKNQFFSMALALFTILQVKCPVLAAPSAQISTADSKAVEQTIFGCTKEVIKAVGGGGIGIGLMLVAFQMIFCHKKPEARTQAMESILWIGGGSIILGCIALFTGFFWGAFQQ